MTKRGDGGREKNDWKNDEALTELMMAGLNNAAAAAEAGGFSNMVRRGRVFW